QRLLNILRLRQREPWIVRSRQTDVQADDDAQGPFASHLSSHSPCVLQILEAESEGKLTPDMVTLLLRGGSTLTPEQVPDNPFAKWLQKEYVSLAAVC